MPGDIKVSSDGVSLSWKVFVAAFVLVIGYYVGTQIAPLRRDVTTNSAEAKEAKVERAKMLERIHDLELKVKGGS